MQPKSSKLVWPEILYSAYSIPFSAVHNGDDRNQTSEEFSDSKSPLTKIYLDMNMLLDVRDIVYNITKIKAIHDRDGGVVQANLDFLLFSPYPYPI